MKIFKQGTPKKLAEIMSAMGCAEVQAFCTDTGLSVIRSLDISSDGSAIWHISASGRTIRKLPTYSEIKQLRYALCPSARYMAEIFPPEEEFVNVDKYCRHLHEISNVRPEIFGRR